MRSASSQPMPSGVIVSPARLSSSAAGTDRSSGCGLAIRFRAYATIARARSSVSSLNSCISCIAMRQASLLHELLAELAERVDVLLDVFLRVLHRDRPLLLVARGHEDRSEEHTSELQSH